LFLSPCLFFITRPRPPSSTLFPYTTLFRSHSGNLAHRGRALVQERSEGCWIVVANIIERRLNNQHALWIKPRRQRLQVDQASDRSEEHTSELQSLAYLVCRLLLEKKKQNTN